MVIICILLVIICIYLAYENRAIKKEINYISQRMDSILENNEKSHILLASQEPEIRALLIKINQLLDRYYDEKCIQNKRDRDMKQMITNISHDLKTPITVLKGYMEILLSKTDTYSLHDEVRTILLTISNKTDRLVDAIQDIFLLARIQSKDYIVEEERIEINQVCKEVLLDYFEILEENDIEVDLKLQEMPIWYSASETSLKRILKNLIDNTIKYGSDGKYLGISTCEEAERITIQIINRGKAIPKDKLYKIFERSYQEERDNIGGGIGLTIVKELVHELGGSVSAQSTVGEETVFEIVFMHTKS